ncbi:TauD/TfdA family dioxygenase [Kitasatospora sp. NPDC048545]|uniref:TauD/TfdA family dioxygenase n=1 Tax=Kitasatospora sp. NPDC048545 TaxID=3157208 RepID=UPI0033C21839
MPLNAITDDFFQAGPRRDQPGLNLARESVGATIRGLGAAGLAGLRSRADVLEAARLLMEELRVHRDSGPDGLTVVRDLGQVGHRAGYGGFGRAALLPHTDGTQVAEPPRLVLLACQVAARSGGETVLVDGNNVLREMASAHPDAFSALTQPRAAYFGGAAGHFAPVLRQVGDGRWQIRLRLDPGLARFSPDAEPHLPALRDVVRRHAQTILLRPGQALLIDNERTLHGRSAFTGERLLLRALGTPHPQLRLLPGFAAALDEQSSHGTEQPRA